MRALTHLSEEDELFRSSVAQFARERLAPHVRAMDEAGIFRKDLLREFFELGLMGIDVPEAYGGQGGTFFQAVLAWAQVRGASSVRLEVIDGNDRARRLYEKHGFEATGQIALRPRDSAREVQMERPVGNAASE